MKNAIRVDSGFATPYDTAKVLGVSKSRTEALIKIARLYTDRILKDRAGRKNRSANSVNQIPERHGRRKSTASVARKSRVRDAGPQASPAKSTPAKTNHS